MCSGHASADIREPHRRLPCTRHAPAADFHRGDGKLGCVWRERGNAKRGDASAQQQGANAAHDATGVAAETLANGGVLGKDPHTQEDIALKVGRFGPYVQRGDGKDAKRSGLPKGWKPEDVDIEKALALLSLPRDVGKHPESGKMISAGLGRYGPFLLHDGAYANLESIEDVFSVGLNRAVSVIAEKKANPGRGRASTPAALKALGDHPDGGAVTVREGRYGAYVTHGAINATLPKG